MSKVRGYADSIFSGVVFKVLYLVLTVLSFNSFVYYQPQMKYAVYIVVLFGALNCAYRLFHYKKFIKMPYLVPLLLFLGSYLLTAALNMKYGIRESAEGFIWLVLQFAMLYVVDMDKPYEKLKKEFTFLAVFFSVLITVSCIISLVMVSASFGEVFILDKTNVMPRGFVWGRLWGIFTDPNYASVSACANAMIALYFLNKKKSLTVKLFAAIALAASFLYIVFSDSRTGYVSFFACIGVWSYLKFFASFKPLFAKVASKAFLHKTACVFLSGAIALGSIGAMRATAYSYNYIAEQISDHYVSQDGEQKKDVDLKIDRKYEEEEKADISNRRFAIWKSGLEVFAITPIAGVGFRTLQDAVREKLPDTYLLNNSLGEFDAFHNMWVDVLASQGIIGLTVFLTFTLLCVYACIKLIIHMKKYKKDGLVWSSFLLSIIVASVVSSFFLSDTLYVNTPNAVMFWTALGYMMRLYHDTRKPSSAPDVSFVE